MDDRKILIGYLGLGIVLLGGLWLLGCVRWEVSEDVVSGIVYDATFNGFISGNTTFKVRAAAEMATSKDTSRTYCLPPNSDYTELIRKAAGDKTVKVVVETRKGFRIMGTPLECFDNVVVREVE